MDGDGGSIEAAAAAAANTEDSQPPSTTQPPDVDPFACFGDDEDDDSDNDGAECDNDGANSNQQDPLTTAVPSSSTRDDNSCGVLTFHAGTEVALWHYVQQRQHDQLQQMNTRTTTTTSNTTTAMSPSTTTAVSNSTLLLSISFIIHKAQQILDHIDEFCWKRHWMMHIGAEKGVVLKDFLLECYRSHQGEAEKVLPFQILELGTYCGYSAIFLVKTLLEELLLSNSDHDNVASTSINNLIRLTTVEVVPANAQIARNMIQLAGMESFIDIVLLPAQDDYDEASTLSLPPHLPINTFNTFNHRRRIDFLFLDHDKSRYLLDLQALQQSRHIQKGTYVAADNVVFAQIDDYRQYLHDLASRGVVTTRLVEGFLEYSQSEPRTRTNNTNITNTSTRTAAEEGATATIWKDGMELSIYQQYPTT
jgi:catechol O-methyltransferase